MPRPSNPLPQPVPTQPEAAGRICRAQKSVRQAFERWDAANLKRVQECRELLDAAAGELREAALRAPVNHLRLPVEAQRALADLKRDIAVLTKVVDACSAFQRELALQQGHADPNYDASGSTAEEGTPARKVAFDA